MHSDEHFESHLPRNGLYEGVLRIERINISEHIEGREFAACKFLMGRLECHLVMFFTTLAFMATLCQARATRNFVEWKRPGRGEARLTKGIECHARASRKHLFESFLFD